MLTRLKVWAAIVAVITGSSVFAQRIVYSEPERDDSRHMNFEIIGKFGGNYLIYKNIRNHDFYRDSMTMT